MSKFQEILDMATAEHAAELKAEQDTIFSYNRSGTWGRTPNPIKEWPKYGGTPEWETRAKYGYTGDGEIYPKGASKGGWHYTVWESEDGSYLVNVGAMFAYYAVYTSELPDFLALIAHLDSTLGALSAAEMAHAS